MNTEGELVTGRIEASGEESGSQQTEQAVSLALPEYQNYQELLHYFIAKVERWRSVASTPQTFLSDTKGTVDSNTMTDFTTDTRREWKAFFATTPDGESIIAKRRRDLGTEDRIHLCVNSVLKDNHGWVQSYSLHIYRPPNQLNPLKEPLFDPYNGNAIAHIDIVMEQLGAFGEPPDTYTIGINHTYKYPNDPLLEKRLSAESNTRVYYLYRDTLTIGRTDIHFPNQPEIASKLTDDHAKALFDLVDSLIPQASPQLPEPTIAGEQ